MNARTWRARQGSMEVEDTTQESPAKIHLCVPVLYSLTICNFSHHLHNQLATSLLFSGDACTRVLQHQRWFLSRQLQHSCAFSAVVLTSTHCVAQMTERGTAGAGEPQITRVPRVQQPLRPSGNGTTGSDVRLGQTRIYHPMLTAIPRAGALRGRCSCPTFQTEQKRVEVPEVQFPD